MRHIPHPKLSPLHSTSNCTSSRPSMVITISVPWIYFCSCGSLSHPQTLLLPFIPSAHAAHALPPHSSSTPRQRALLARAECHYLLCSTRSVRRARMPPEPKATPPRIVKSGHSSARWSASPLCDLLEQRCRENPSRLPPSVALAKSGHPVVHRRRCSSLFRQTSACH
jgi:hypothetical protein